MRNYFFNSFILFLIGIIIVSSHKCIKPQICVPIKHCSSINELLFEKNLTEDENQTIYLKNLQCGFKNGLVYVCCNSTLPTPENCILHQIKLGDKIINGNETHLGDYPWAVLIGRRWKDKDGSTNITDSCGGSLINDRYILTAAHCVTFLSSEDFKEHLVSIENVKLGEWNITSDPDVDPKVDKNSKVYVQNVEVEKIIPHHKYRVYKRYNDIALIKLKKKIEFTKFLNPICLPNKNQIISEPLTVIGWGTTESTREILSDILRQAKINFVSNEECSKKHKNIIKSTQLCAGSQGIDSCRGDSGGALMGEEKFYKYLVGIVSYGSRKCGEEGVPGVYTDVTKYINWIEQTIEH